MQSINFKNGNFKSFAINGDENNIIKINVSDMSIITRLKKAMSKIDEIVSGLENIEGETVNVAEFLAEQDEQARNIVNDIFGLDVCTAAFGRTNVFSTDERGRPILINFMEALMPLIANEIKSAQTAAQIQLEDKTDKYIKPVTEQSKPSIISMVSQPAIDISKLTQEQKNAMLRELLK